MQSFTRLARHLCSQSVSIFLPNIRKRNARKQPPTLAGTLIEIGTDSVLLAMDTSIRKGARVHIRCNSHQLTGFVHASRADKHRGASVEVRLDPYSRWSKRWFTPDHLLESIPAFAPNLGIRRLGMRQLDIGQPGVPPQTNPLVCALSHQQTFLAEFSLRWSFDYPHHDRSGPPRVNGSRSPTLQPPDLRPIDKVVQFITKRWSIPRASFVLDTYRSQ
jgi:hypothetical protein